MVVSQRQRVTLTDMAFGGECLGRIDKQVVFASHGLPGEEVIVELTQNRRDYQRGRVVDVLRPSPARIEPRCPLFGRCGGCQWQHIDYPTQTELKRKIVADQLRRIGGFGEAVPVNPTLGAEDPWHYRNHGRFSVHQSQLGFLEEGSHRFLAVDQCYLLHPAINEALASLQGKPPGCPGQVAIRYGVNTGQLLIHQVAPADESPHPPQRERARVRASQAIFKADSHYGANAPTQDQPSEARYLEEDIRGRRFRFAATAFFQVNTTQSERLIGYAIEQLKPTQQDTVLDLYCGVGVFGLLMAGEAGRVIGVEESAVAVQDARYNAHGVENVVFIEGAAERVLSGIRENVTAAIVDPPRAGCKREVVNALRRLHPHRIVYVSCDPATLARDLKLLCAGGQYTIVDVQPVDMFPQTYHIETVATLHAP